MKRVAILLLFLIPVSLFAQEKSFAISNIVGTDSTYYIKPFRTSGPVMLAFDFTDFTCDNVILDVFYVFVTDAGLKRPKSLELGVSSATLPVTLVKATYQTISNKDTTHMVVFKIPDNFYGDQLGVKVTKGSATSADILKMYIRK